MGESVRHLDKRGIVPRIVFYHYTTITHSVLHHTLHLYVLLVSCVPCAGVGHQRVCGGQAGEAVRQGQRAALQDVRQHTVRSSRGG